MKKIILTLALVAFGMTASAQWVIGGNVAFQHTNNHTNDYVTGTSSTDFSIMPKVGYWLNENMQIGMQFGYAMNYNRNYTGASDRYTSNKSHYLDFSPYFRYNVAQWKSFTVFCEAQLGVRLNLESSTYNKVTNTTSDLGDNFTQFGLAVVPGLNYSFTDKISMDIYVNLLGIALQMNTADGWGGHQFGLIANMDAQSLNAHLNNFAIGFNYAL